MSLNIALVLLVTVPALSLLGWRSWQRERRRRKLIILQLIDSRGKSFGLEIGDGCGIDSDALYPLLRDMEDAGLLVSKHLKTTIKVRDARSLIYYSVTDKGKAYIENHV